MRQRVLEPNSFNFCSIPCVTCSHLSCDPFIIMSQCDREISNFCCAKELNRLHKDLFWFSFNSCGIHLFNILDFPILFKCLEIDPVLAPSSLASCHTVVQGFLSTNVFNFSSSVEGWCSQPFLSSMPSSLQQNFRNFINVWAVWAAIWPRFYS